MNKPSFFLCKRCGMALPGGQGREHIKEFCDEALSQIKQIPSVSVKIKPKTRHSCPKCQGNLSESTSYLGDKEMVNYKCEKCHYSFSDEVK